MTKVRQVGLYVTHEENLEAFADRVSEFNKEKGFVMVEMEGRESEPDQLINEPHWKIDLQFASRSISKEFWTHPDYQQKILNHT